MLWSSYNLQEMRINFEMKSHNIPFVNTNCRKWTKWKFSQLSILTRSFFHNFRFLNLKIQVFINCDNDKKPCQNYNCSTYSWTVLKGRERVQLLWLKWGGDERREREKRHLRSFNNFLCRIDQTNRLTHCKSLKGEEKKYLSAL